MKEIYFSGGSFWGLQKYFDMIFGVISTDVGYINGNCKTTNYLKLTSTGHAQAVHITYNPRIISLTNLLNFYYEAVNPTSYVSQGQDKGYQYRLGIYYVFSEDLPIIINSLEQLNKRLQGKVAIDVKRKKNYVLAERYHQKFLKHNPFGYCSINEKVFEQLQLNQLDNISYRVMKLKDTEKPFDNKYYKNFKEGIYVDKENGLPLFSSNNKYNAKTGFPSFYDVLDENNIIKKLKIKNLQLTIELLSKSGNHIGYLYYDGPKKLGGLRYSVNSAALRFIPKHQMIKEGYSEYINLV